MGKEDDRITVHKVDLGFNVEEEMSNALKEEINPETVKDGAEILEALSDKPGNKKAIEKIETESKLNECLKIIEDKGIITKDQLTEITGKNTISSVGLLRNYVKKTFNKKLSKTKDGYVLED